MRSNKPVGTIAHPRSALVWAATLAMLAAGCTGPAGDTGPKGDPGTDGTNGTDGTPGAPGENSGFTTSVMGTVTNSLSNEPLAGVKVETDPAVEGIDLRTDANGNFQGDLPLGFYTFTFSLDNYAPLQQTASLIADHVASLNVSLTPADPVVVTAGDDQTAAPGDTLTLDGTVDIWDGSTVIGYQWTQLSGPTVDLSDPTAESTTVTLPDLATYKDELFQSLTVLDRLMVQPVNPYSLEEAGTATFQLTVTTSSGVWQDTLTVETELPWKVNPGLANVPIQTPVLVHGKDAASYKWILSAPSGSKATLSDGTSQNPYFTPDLAGTYVVSDQVSSKSISITAGTWQGAITGQGTDGYPLAANCTLCHNDKIAPDKFTDWRMTGHANIFSDNLNTGTHYGTDCFSCHTVGFDTTAANGGFDDQTDYGAFMSAGLLNNPSPDNWTKTLASYPNTARMANVQCESCHGPNVSSLHNNGVTGDAARVSIASEVCATCHGEPSRHGRYQQWQRSAHADYELPEDEGTVESRGTTANHCGRCHTGQGFIQWVKQGDFTKVLQGANGNATTTEMTAWGMTTDSVQPQTCATCHAPHATGDTAFEPNNATVRVSGDVSMLPSGFDATGVGRGAVCIACHNTRNGAHNDTVGNPTSYSLPHTPSQSDVLLGENAYFVAVGARGGHSYLTDTCATCHMEESPPPADLSYNGTGTNHQFNASLSICQNCHGDFNGGTLQAATTTQLETLAAKLSSSAMSTLNAEGTLFVRAHDLTTDLYSSSSSSNANVKLDVTSNPIVSVSLLADHGQGAFVLTLTNAITFTLTDGSSLTTKTFSVQLVSLLDSSSAPLYSLGGGMVRAFWNYSLINSDGSKGVHNPEYVQDVLDATMKADLTN